MPRTRNGFSLIEALVAILLIATAVASLAHLMALAVMQSAAVRNHSQAIGAAQSKLEELTASSSLLPSGSLVEDQAGFSDYLDVPGAVHIRRWAISRLEATDAEPLVIDVCVFRLGREQPDACVSTVRWQRP